jgi:alanyl-tRNA synthetase
MQDEAATDGGVTEPTSTIKAAAGKIGSQGDQALYLDLLQLGATEFTGYEELESEGTVRGLIRDAKRVPTAHEGDIVEIVLDRTPLYAESGGQDSDAGILIADGLQLDVLDVQKVARKLWVHQVRVAHGEVVEGQQVVAKVDPDWRLSARKAHSGTHVIHAALRQVLGPQALQAGSYNKPGYLRLDFSWTGGLSAETRNEVEEVSNLAVSSNLPVRVIYTSLQQAKDMDAVALFDDAYGDEVRVVEIGGAWSRELCGGTHVNFSSEIGPLVLFGDHSVGSGLRRIEAYVGVDAYRYLSEQRALALRIADTLNVPVNQTAEEVSALISQLHDTERQIAELRASQLKSLVSQFTAYAMDVQGVSVVARHLSEPVNSSELRAFVLGVQDLLADTGRPVVVAVTGLSDDKPIIAIAVNDSGRQRGFNAGNLVRVATQTLGGRGGGKADIAQGGGTDGLAVGDALADVTRAIEEAAGHRAE